MRERIEADKAEQKALELVKQVYELVQPNDDMDILASKVIKQLKGGKFQLSIGLLDAIIFMMVLFLVGLASGCTTLWVAHKFW